mgnify:CR=1 FL=1
MVDGPNTYGFCGGDPVNNTDPTGTIIEVGTSNMRLGAGEMHFGSPVQQALFDLMAKSDKVYWFSSLNNLRTQMGSDRIRRGWAADVDFTNSYDHQSVAGAAMRGAGQGFHEGSVVIVNSMTLGKVDSWNEEATQIKARARASGDTLSQIGYGFGEVGGKTTLAIGIMVAAPVVLPAAAPGTGMAVVANTANQIAIVTGPSLALISGFQSAKAFNEGDITGGISHAGDAALIGLMTVDAATNFSLKAEAEALAKRADEVHGVLNVPKPDPRAVNSRTTSCLSTNEETLVAGGAAKPLNGRQIEALNPGEANASVPGLHSEQANLMNAGMGNLRPRALGASRPFCGPERADCLGFIREAGGTITGPRTAIWLAPEVDSTIFWSTFFALNTFDKNSLLSKTGPE